MLQLWFMTLAPMEALSLRGQRFATDSVCEEGERGGEGPFQESQNGDNHWTRMDAYYQFFFHSQLVVSIQTYDCWGEF